MNEDRKRKFYESIWFTILMLILITPVGVFLLWKNKIFHMAIRIILSIFAVPVIFIGLLFWIGVFVDTPVEQPTTNEVVEDKKEEAVKQNKEVKNNNYEGKAFDSKEEEIKEVVNDNMDNSDTSLSSSDEIEECVIGEYDYLENYSKKYDIKLHEFKERNKILKSLEKLNSDKNMSYLKVDSQLFSNNYKITNSETDIIYCGEIKDNKPHGVGAIYQIVDGQSFIKYAGNFKKGKFEGYGMLFNIPTDDEYYYSTTIYEDQEDAIKRANFLTFEGSFKDGHPNGKGNYYEYCDLQMEMYLVQDGYDKSKDINIYIGDFEVNDDGLTGKGKMYSNGCLLYDGEYKDGNYDGKGTLYFKNSQQVQYKGEFKNGNYNGKGTLYDENGNKVYSGKWSMGDYK